ncbi:MAG: carbamoyl-phosphate synthase subunit L [Acidobacteria bacterium]|nr:MAG: carbamoyl-phosphate synthase subunit L [Acidobacteriota bacterium]
MNYEFERVAIVNRGEAAMRFIHAARDFNQEHGTSLRTIALFNDCERHAMFVREADEAFCLGPTRVLDPTTQQCKSSYVDYGCLQRALAAAGADAVWVGWGFVAEQAAFADLCREMNIVFIGPDGDIMRRVGDKIASKLLAQQANVPVAPWSQGPVETMDEALTHARRLGFPLLIKATAGGGGHGIRKVISEDQLLDAFESARSEAFKAFGDPTVFLERLITGARHVEVQIIADNFGTTWAAGVRDCTVQRRHQKVLEEAPSPALSSAQDLELRNAAVRLSQFAGYRNAGTVEFLYQPDLQAFSFMEINTRLQVEHPVTECTTGLDMVKLQIHVARGGRLLGDPPRTSGCAIEVRLNAEDPDSAFAPSPGLIERFKIPTGPGIRIDTGVGEGDTVPAEFDSMIAKVIAYGRDRNEAISRLQRALRESVVVIKGGASNKSFLQGLLARDEVQRAEVHVGWLDRLAASGDHLSREYADVALVHAAIESYEAQLAVERAQFYASAVRGRPQIHSELGRTAELRYRGQAYSPKVCRLGPETYRVEVDGLRIEVDGVAHRIDRDDGGIVHAPSPSVVVSIAVKPGDSVSAGDRLLVLEAMKMEMQVLAPFSGKVRQVMTMRNVQVDAGAPLVQIDPSAEDRSTCKTERIVFPARSAVEKQQGAASETRRTFEQLRQLMLGFDVDPKETGRLLSEWNKRLRSGDHETRDMEDDILSIFVDICSLFRREPEVNHRASGEEPSSEAFLFSYLRMLETRGEGLPPLFVQALRRALSHYGVHALDPSPKLQESLLWIYKSHQRVESQIPVVLAVLERRLSPVEALTCTAENSFRPLLDRLIAESNGHFPSVSDLAREVRYRFFDQPLFDQARKQVYDKVEEQLAYLAANPDSDDRDERVRELVECPQPLVGLLSSRFAAADMAMQNTMLQAIVWRYYRIRNLQKFRSFEADGRCYATAEYEHEGRQIHVVATHSDCPGLGESLTAMCRVVADTPADHDVVLDFHAWNPGPLAEPDVTQQNVSALLNATEFPRPIRRIVVEVASPLHSRGVVGMQHFTYRSQQVGFEEEKLYRGIHPMMAKRLHMWRLNNFNVERLPSIEDVYLLRAVAKENPKDERLFAVAEVRDVTPRRDQSGRVVALPHLERMLSEAAAAIRNFQSHRPLKQRLYWNRIFLYVWQPFTLEREEFRDIVKRLAPSVEGIGLEQVVIRARIPSPATGELRDMTVRISSPAGRGMLITFRPADKMQPMRPLAEYDQKVVRMRQRGMIYPYEIIRMLTPPQKHTRAEFPPGDFAEYDLDGRGEIVKVDRPYGQNKCNIILGVIRNFTSKYPEGMARVILLGDPSKDLGALAEAECRRIMAAIDLAEEMKVPLEWFPISAGAKISMDSGVENMDWIARVLRRLVEFTQSGGEVNLIINGINVGAQPYWNAEATMLMHTRGILVMTPNAAMVLTGKRALDYSGGISAEDNQGIGGYDRIMGINGQAQYWAHDIDEACQILFRHYDHTYVMPGERFPRRAATSDAIERDVQDYAHAGDGFARVGDIFNNETNPGRKKSFDIRSVMMATVDQDHAPLERWAGMRAAETAVVWDAHLGGYPVCLIGMESRQLPRLGFVPADGPDQWTSGTLFPQSSKKVARAINAASNNRPVVMLANLSGFDGSPESMRRLQLEYGAEIGRAIVNFKGPVVFCVISRYHGGAYVVFSRALNAQLEVAALEGTYASVIGGAPAAAVVFAGEVETRARKDPRLQELTQAMAKAEAPDKIRLRAQWDELFKVIHSEKLGEMAAEFDRVHSVQRALAVGALDCIIPPHRLRPYLIDAIERGIRKEEEKLGNEITLVEEAA